MRWLRWFRRDRADESEAEPVNVERAVAEGLRDRQSARSAITRLTRYRESLTRQRRVLERQFNHPTPVRVRNMAHSGPAMGSYQLSQDMQELNAKTQDSARGEQVAETERQIRAVDDAVKRLSEYVRRP